MIPIEKDGKIVLKHHSSSLRAVATLNAAEAEKLVIDLQIILDNHRQMRATRTDAAIRAISRELETRSLQLRGKQPWELTLEQWNNVHAPVRWTIDRSANDIPLYLKSLLVADFAVLKLSREAERIFEAKMGYFPHGRRATGGFVSPEHELHVAHALSKGLAVPSWVLASYPNQFWIAKNMSWVLRHLDLMAWSAHLSGRQTSSSEAMRLEASAISCWRSSFRNLPRTLNDPGQWYENWTTEHINQHLAVSKIAA